MAVRTYRLTKEEAADWLASEQERTRIRGLARLKCRTRDRDRNPVTVEILSPDGETLGVVNN